MSETSITTQSARPPKTSTVSTSATPLPAKSGEAMFEASEISRDSTQNLSRQSPKNANIEAATTEASIATLPADSAPLQSSVGANVDASGDSTQKHLDNLPRMLIWQPVLLKHSVLPQLLSPSSNISRIKCYSI